MSRRAAYAALLSLIVAPLLANAAPTEREVSFPGAGDVKLSGTLTLPAGATADARVPAVVLVQGSGPTDRDGNQPPLLWTGLLKQVAAALADGGIASLRYDKRGQYRSGAHPKGTAALAEFVRWEYFVDDVVAATAALRQQPEVDANRVALLGHSEGGLLVMHATLTLQEAGRAPAAVVLAATPGRPLNVVLREQLDASFERLGVARAGIDKVLARNDSIVSEIMEKGVVPPDVPLDLAPLYPRYIGRFLQSQFRSDPADLAGRLAVPVLVLQGGKDIQVSAERDAPLLVAALKMRPGGMVTDFTLVEGASHNLKPVKTDGEFGYFGPVAPEAREKLVRWLAGEFKPADASDAPAERRTGDVPEAFPAPRASERK